MITRVREWTSYRASRTPTLHQRASRSDPQWAASPQCTSTGDKSELQNMLTHAMDHSHVAAPARGRLLGLRTEIGRHEKACNTLASRRCWPTATSCSPSGRNILAEHVGCHQKAYVDAHFLHVRRLPDVSYKRVIALGSPLNGAGHVHRAERRARCWRSLAIRRGLV